ncbi:MAG TPA: PEGA domain-containing protein [Blastocatellia bacterium]
MKTKTSAILAIAILLSIQLQICAQSQQDQQAQEQKGDSKPPDQPPTQSLKPAIGFGLEDGTPIRMRITRTLSSADAKVDDRVDFEVLDDIKVGPTIIVPRGSIAWGTVTEAVPKRRMGRAGKLNINIDSVRLADGERAALRAVKEAQGGSHTGAMTGAMVATSIVFFPAAPLFLFMKGKDITIPKGTEITAYVNGDVVLDPGKFVAPIAQMQPIAPPAPPPPTGPSVALVTSQAPASPQASIAVQPADVSTVVIKSDPDGADITIDGKFAGSTPSTVKLAPGDHTILVEKSGFKAWQRTLTVGPASNLNLNATLEKASGN